MSRQETELPESVVHALWTVLDYLYADERAHYFGSPPEQRHGHIFESVLILHTWLRATGRTRSPRS